MNDNFLIIMLFIFMGKKNNDNKVFGINTMELDHQYSMEKIKMVKKIGPYFPENYLPIINKSISFANKFIKINDAMNFVQNNDESYILEHIPMDKKERTNKIISTIQNEPLNFKKGQRGQIGQILDLVLNMDKYEKMFGVLNKLMTNPNSLNDPSQLINLIGPLMGSEMEDNSSKIKEMSKMMELMKLLDTPKKEANTK